MKLPMLYARSETGKVLEWQIEVEDGCYRTITGAQDAQHITNAWTACTAKSGGRANATTPEEQAVKEAQALWKKKLKSGGYWENPEDIDGQRFIQPMLANKLVDRKAKLDFSAGLIVQLKFNGVRCIATKDGLFSRKGERFVSVPHIEQDLKQFFEQYPQAVLDGECYNYDYRQQLNEVMKLCRKTVNISTADLIRSTELIRYYVYDGYGFGGQQETVRYVERKAFIDSMLPKVTTYCRQVVDYVIHTEAELDEIYQRFLADAQEGAIIRIPDSAYEHRRSNNLLKFKPVEDQDFEILDVMPGAGNWAGKARIITLKYGDKQFNADFKGTMAEAEEMLANKHNYIGQIARIYFFGYSGLGIPNYAKFDYLNWRV